MLSPAGSQKLDTLGMAGSKIIRSKDPMEFNFNCQD